MNECLNSTLKEFKYSVVKPVKFFNRVKSLNLPEYSNITYSQFRTRNISFDIFEAAFLNIDNDNVISPIQLRNMFKYLSNNLKGYREADIKRVVIRIEKLKINLTAKLCELDPELDKIATENIDNILVELTNLKNIIIDPAKNSNRSIEKEIQFEMLIDDLLYPDDYDTSTLLPTLFYNLPILGNNPSNGKKFNEKIYRALLSSMHENNNIQKKYYITLANLIKQANIYKIEKKVSNLCGFKEYDSNVKTKLEEKISKLDYDNNKGRYRLDDFIVTIDNETTSKFDDAISIEKMDNGSYILGIHIADVYSLGILPSSNESIEFKSRASLCENVEKNAISLFVEISNKGLIIDKRMIMSNIRVNNNLLYDDVSKILSNKNNDKLCQTIIDLIGLYNIVDNTKLPDFPGPSSMAHALVQKYMLLYGCVASSIASENRYPILYQLDSDKKSEVTLNEVHVYTGFEENDLSTYARFTSPIWDVRSFINQFSMCKCIFDHIDTKEKNALRIQMSGYKNKINRELKLKLKNSSNDSNSLQE